VPGGGGGSALCARGCEGVDARRGACPIRRFAPSLPDSPLAVPRFGCPPGLQTAPHVGGGSPPPVIPPKRAFDSSQRTDIPHRPMPSAAMTGPDGLEEGVPFQLPPLGSFVDCSSPSSARCQVRWDALSPPSQAPPPDGRCPVPRQPAPGGVPRSPRGPAGLGPGGPGRRLAPCSRRPPCRRGAPGPATRSPLRREGWGSFWMGDGDSRPVDQPHPLTAQ